MDHHCKRELFSFFVGIFLPFYLEFSPVNRSPSKGNSSPVLIHRRIN